MLNKITNILLLLLSGLIPFAYHPMFFNSSGEQVGFIGDVIMLITLILFVLQISKIKKILSSAFVKVYLFLFTVFFVEVFVFYSFGLYVNFMEVRTLAIPLVLICAGFLCDCDKSMIRKICFIFMIVMLFCGFEQIRLNVGGFVIEDQYATSAKNSVGPMLAIGGTISALSFLNEKKYTLRFVLAVVTFVFLLELLTIRARLATIAYLFMLVALFVKYIIALDGARRTILLFSLFLLVLFVCVIGMSRFDFFIDYFYNSFFQNKENDMLSGRGEIYYQSWQLVSLHPLFGNLTEYVDIPRAHNYFLLTLFKYGFVGGLPCVLLYFYMGKCVLFSFLKSKSFCEEYYGYVLMLIPFIASLGEPTFPYGPGTAVFLPFLLFGCGLCSNLKTKNEY